MSGATHRPSGRRSAEVTAEERELFRTTLRNVKPLAAGRRRAPPSVGGPAVPARAEPPLVPSARVDAAARSKPRGATARANPGIDRSTAERLRKGEIPIERRLDLHGLTQDDAHAALDRFVRGAWSDGRRMLLVITGKGSVSAGGGVLRRAVPRWLAAGEHAPRVLRISPAQPRHGGSGAFYVLLRRRRAES